jgi:HK97 family phage prohead protease
MLLRKNLSLSEVDLKMEGDTGKFTGYASVFGGVDSYGDTIVKGAFESTLRTHGKPKMYLEHSWSGFSASGSGLLPIGKFELIKEDDHGLLVTGELTPNMSVSADVRAAMLHGTVDGLSIGGFVKKGDYDETDNGRVIRKWSRLLEISVVAMPADSAARIDNVKSEGIEAAIAEISTIRDLEYFLRDASGFSKGAAQALTARVKTLFNSRDAGEQMDTKTAADFQARIDRILQIGV